MNNKMKIIPSLVSATVLAVASNSVYAAGTAAGTDIDNTASISYSVSGTAQTPIESSEAGNSTPGTGNGTATTFKVDKKIDVLVSANSGVNVVPGATGQAITFDVTNEGNSTEDFDLAATQVATGDDFDTTGCTITAPASPVNLAADASATVTIECDIPPSSTTVTNGTTSIVDLEATINGVTESTGADTAAGVEVVFADDTGTSTDGANRNGSHSAENTYTVNTADLIVQKTSAVISDPFNLTTNPKRIPGATIEYNIVVTNADGAADAESLVISDILASDLTYVSCSVSGDAVTAPTCSESGGTVSTTGFTLPGGSGAATSETLTIRATVD